MSNITYIAAPASMTAHSFDDEGTLHSLPIVAWWQDSGVNVRKPDQPPNLHPVVVTEQGAPQHGKTDCVITAADELPSAVTLLDSLTKRLQADARTTAAGKVAPGKPFGDSDCEALGKAAKDHTGQNGRPFTAYLVDGPGAHDLSILSRRYVADRGLIEQTEDEPTHPFLHIARAGLPTLVKGGRVKP